jgi:hypothetical protein
MATKLRVKFLMPHGDNEVCSYTAMDAAQAAKLEAKGIVQIRGVATGADEGDATGSGSIPATGASVKE